MTQGWGSGEWGSSQWGLGSIPPVSLPTITPLDPLENGVDVPQSKRISIRLTDNTGVVLSSLTLSVSGIIYVLGGVAQNGATFTTTANDGNGFDIELSLPDPMPLGTRQEVAVLVRDSESNEATKNYFFTVGIGPRLINVRNPQPGVLAAYFNRPMRIDSAFLFAPNWVVEAVTPGASPVAITEVMANPGKPDIAFLKYEGGGSDYRLTVLRLLSQEGDEMQLGHNSVVFELIFGAEDDPTIRLFDTIFGPIGTSQRLRQIRTLDDHVVNRSIAIGMDEQFRLRFAALDQTTVRSGVPGKRRT